ncbi:iron transport multicopper oxidase FET3 [Rhizodiscina lignyota]|uniref:Iron transport multicopper oxidase FET3 n=1 Tax=Rhizodiscina lignyota TaxID=1504668 RepID=A0A9P4MGJ5_9PEZI|nr:iron transport multicopper oxidase FET3 [Rhizodiscina lignyota]
MALSLSNFRYCCFALLSFSVFCNAVTVTYNFNATWVTANPDGAFPRPVIGINNQWPLPVVRANKGDTIVVHFTNLLGNQSSSLHWHGIYQNGTTHMDGAVGVSQCEVGPGRSLTYNFTVNQVGTYWYHSHINAQYPDGIRGPLIIEDPDNPYADEFDEELLLTLSDWYHDQMPNLMASFVSVTNPTGAEPVPDAALMNDTQNLQIKIQPGKTYMIRIANIAAFAGQYFWIEGHTMRIIEVDGIYTKAAEASMIYITAAQRYSVLVTMKNDTSKNYAIVGSMDEDLFDTVPPTLNPNVTSFLIYDQSKDLPTAALLDEFDPFDDFTLEAYDDEKLFENVDHSIELTLKMDNLGNGANYAFFNDISFVTPKVPILFSALSTGNAANNATVYGANSNAFVLQRGEVVEIVLNNNDPGKHPFHLHGHNFQLAWRADDEAGDYDPNNATFHSVPMRRDTVMVRPDANMVLRFRADNPGVWFFHCHIEWHLATGLAVVMVEAPLDLQKSLKVPEDFIQACRDSNTPFEGNAAGNTKDVFDLTGENKSIAPLPAGFTARGIVALVFSCVSAFLGLAVIAWYGAAPIGTAEVASAQRRIVESGQEE